MNCERTFLALLYLCMLALKSGMLHLYSVGEIHGKISLVQSNSTKNIGG